MATIINYGSGNGTTQDLSEYAKKTDVSAELAGYVKQETHEYDISKCAKLTDIAEDLVSLTTENASITATLRNGEEYSWTIDNVANAKNADIATKATCDSKGYNIVNSYTRANSIATDITGKDDTITVNYTKNTNGTHSVTSSDIKINNVEHAKTADSTTVAVQDENGYNIAQSYIRTATLVSYMWNEDSSVFFQLRTNTNGSLSDATTELVIDNVAHAKEATKATQDGAGKVIADTYTKKADLATVATTGSYNDLTDKPTFSDDYTLPIASATILGGIKINETDFSVDDNDVFSVVHAATAECDGEGNSITETYAKKVDLATVATTGSYDDLANKPTIPEEYVLPIASTTTLGGIKLADNCWSIDADGTLRAEYANIAGHAYTDGAGQIIEETYAQKSKLAKVATSGSYADLSNTPTIPTKLSELTNDGVFVTEAKVQEMIDAITSADGKEY